MNEYIAIQDIQAVLEKKRLLPTVVMWNRLECRPRTDDFDRALKAEVRDPLFMLTRQWQMGEFRGDDAGSPVFAKVHMATTRLNKYRADSHAVQLFENEVPLEAKVEQRLLPFAAGGQKLSLDICLSMGRQWLKLVKGTAEIASLKNDFIRDVGFAKPDPTQPDDALVCAHRQVWQQFAAVAGRCMDGARLYLYLKEDINHHAYDLLTSAPTATQKGKIEELEGPFIQWFEELFYQPLEEDKDAWMPSRLEYQFACSAPKAGKEKLFTAEEYYHGHLDWYNFNVDMSTTGLGEIDGSSPPVEPLEDAFTYSFIPTQLQFDGMPNSRWWSFEDGKTNFGDINPDTTDLNKLLLIEFGLVYANDWFMVPFTLPAGSIAQVKGMSVTNVFGERIWVQAAGRGSDQQWQRWNMYTLSTTGSEAVAADMSLMLLPTVPKIQEGAPLEEVRLLRDEMANMVWGLEHTIPLPSGDSKAGREAALELHNYYQRLVDAGPGLGTTIDYHANIRYQIMNSVPEHWIPFIPVHMTNDHREIQLQRAAMPRILEGDPNDPVKIRPRTQLLRPGLDTVPAQAYMLFEEEVPRAGIVVTHSYQRTRWFNGKVFNWLGARKQTGRGEGSSGLAFDHIVPVKKAT